MRVQPGRPVALAGLHVDAKLLVDSGILRLAQAGELKDQRFGHQNSLAVVARERPKFGAPPVGIRRRAPDRITFPELDLWLPGRRRRARDSLGWPGASVV